MRCVLRSNPDPLHHAAAAHATRAGRRRARTVCTVMLVLAVGQADAQGLNLGPPKDTPTAGEGLAALALADILEKEARGFRAPDQVAAKAVRTLAARLLRDGEGAGEPGGPAVLAGLTIAAKRDDLDTLLNSCDMPTRRYITDVIDAATPSVQPREIDLLLRDALAPITTDTACGWWIGAAHAADNPLPTEQLAALRSNRYISDPAAETIDALTVLCRDSEHEPAYHSTAARWSQLVIQAAPAVGELPDWLDMPARDRLRADVSASVVLIFDAPGEASAGLSRIASLLDIINRTDALDSGLQSRELRAAVNQLVAAAEGDPKRVPGAVAAIHNAYARALTLLGAEDRAELTPERLVRQVRPLLEPLARAHRDSSDSLARLLPTLLATADPMTEPAVLGAVNAATTTADDLLLPGRLTTMLTTWTGDPSQPPPNSTREPSPTRELSALATHVQKLAIAAAKRTGSEPALAELRTLAGIGTFAFHMPGEDELRGGGLAPEWRAVTGNQRGRIEFLIDQTRGDWIRSCAGPDAETHTRRLRAIAETVGLLRDGARLETARRAIARDRHPTINGWPGVEIARPQLDLITSDLLAELGPLAALAARDNDADAVLTAAAAIRRNHAAALLLARLDRDTEAFAPGACSPADELGNGPAAPDAWMTHRRAEIASICRALFEATAEDGPRRARFLRYANTVAADIAVP